MTKIKPRVNQVWHQTNEYQGGREICVAESPSFCRLRLKGTRTMVELPWSFIFLKAAQALADKRIKERKGERQRRQAVRRGSLSRRG